MKASHVARRPRLVCEMFVELQAASLGKPKPATVTPRDVALVEALMGEGVTFDELKAVLGWLWFTGQGRAFWGREIGTVRELVNAFDTLQTRVDKHFDRGDQAGAVPVGSPLVDVPRPRLGPLSDDEKRALEAMADFGEAS